MTISEQFTFFVEERDFGSRLDVFVSERISSVTRTRVQQLIEKGFVQVDGEVLKPSFRLRSESKVQVAIPAPEPTRLIPEPMDLDILFEDDHLVVINKRAGLTVHPGAGHPTGTLVHGLLDHVVGLSGIGGVERPGIVHRLDKDTSGILVVAKNDHAHQFLSKQFEEHTVVRRYLALVEGKLSQKGSVKGRIGRHPVDRKKFMVVPKGGRSAVTHWTVLERLGPFTLLEVSLETGRTHQIRVHLSSQNNPIVGDPVYGGKQKGISKLNPSVAEQIQGIGRQMLHAGRLEFEHPVDRKRKDFRANPPEDMNDLLQTLRKVFGASTSGDQ